MIKKIISDGQTGAGQAALDVAIGLGIQHGGWIPKGRRGESGKLSVKYKLRETKSIGYAQCTELNTLLSKYFGRPINLYQCEIKTINNMKALITEFDGVMGGTRSMQYQFQKSPSILIIITAAEKKMELMTT